MDMSAIKKVAVIALCAHRVSRAGGKSVCEQIRQTVVFILMDNVTCPHLGTPERDLMGTNPGP